MKSRSLVPAAAALAFTIMACQPGAGPLSDDDIAAIEGLRDAYIEATLQGDWAAVAALFVEDGVRMPPNQPMEEGRAAIQAGLEAGPSVTNFTVTSEIEGVDGLAHDRCTFSLTLVIEEAPEPVTDTGHCAAILRKQADGSWALTSLIWNSDQPLPE